MKSKFFWVGVLYFAEGFPLGIFYDVFPVHFRQQGVDLWKIGSMSLLGLAWTLKFLWAPAIDFFRHHRRWIFLMDCSMALVMVVFAVLLDFGPWVWYGIALFTLLSATSDIAIDAYTIEMLDKKELGLANGIRIGMYRVGMLAAGFILVLSDTLGWRATYMSASAILLVCGVACLLAPREKSIASRGKMDVSAEWRVLIQNPVALLVIYGLFLMGLGLVDISLKISHERPWLWPGLIGIGGLLYLGGKFFSKTQEPHHDDLPKELGEGVLFGATVELLRRPYIIPVIVFILIYKLADTSMGFMVKPFWVDAGFTASQIGLVSVNIGLGLSIAGGLVGGWFTDRKGIFTGIWVLGLAQAVSNLGYALVAMLLPTGVEGAQLTSQHHWLMYGASVVESFTGGLGSAAFLAFLMAIVDKRRSAAEYALLSSVFAFSRSIAGWASGFGAEAMGYAPYFLLTFFLAFPAYALLPWVKKMLEHTKSWD